ncbi:MAG: hypothetical protein R3Y11_09535 [Pseudomonadota bacterium]
MALSLKINDLCKGGVMERLSEALEEAVANCLDPNTEAKKARTVTLTITLKPDEQRNNAQISFVTAVKKQPPVALETSIYMDANPKTGEVDANEAGAYSMNQYTLDGVFDETATSN